MVLWSNFFNENWYHFNQDAYAQLVPVLCRAPWKTCENSQERKGKEEAAIFSPDPSFFVNLRMEFLFGQKMELIFWKACQSKEGLRERSQNVFGGGGGGDGKLGGKRKVFEKYKHSIGEDLE